MRPINVWRTHDQADLGRSWLWMGCIVSILLATAMPILLVAPARAGDEGEPKQKTVSILPGHGGAETGAVHYDSSGRADVVEKDVNLAVAKGLESRLRQAGFAAVLTREGDYSLTPNPADAMSEIQANLDVANQRNADILVAIHHNGYADPQVSGTETYYCPERVFADDSLRLGTSIQKHIVSGLRDVMGYQVQDRGVRSARYKPYGCLYTLGDDWGDSFHPSRMPGVVVEALFVSNDHEASILKQEGGQDLIAAAIFDGIVEYFGSVSGGKDGD